MTIIVGLATALIRRPIMRITLLCTVPHALLWHSSGLRHLGHSAKAAETLPDSCKTGLKCLMEADWGSSCCPTCHAPNSAPSKTLLLLSQKQLKPAANYTQSWKIVRACTTKRSSDTNLLWWCIEGLDTEAREGRGLRSFPGSPRPQRATVKSS